MKGLGLGALTAVTILGALVLIASSLALVTSQSKARALTAQIERLQNESKRLNDDASELHMEISRAALPGYIASQASRAGLAPAMSRNTVTLEYKALPAADGGRP